jgi:Cytochrome oxidase complex assembly protein 1
MEPIPPPIPFQAKGTWWTRNWKWFVPTGCLSLLALFALFVCSIVLIVFGAMKSTDVYKDALARAKANPVVIEALGSPVKEGLFVSGNTNVNGASGEANLSIPISGPKGKATIYLKAEKSLGRWNYSDLVVEIEKTGERIDLKKTPAAVEQL